LSAGDFAMTPAAETWTSPATKATYLVHWQVSIPRLNMQLNVTTPLTSQELASKFGTSYWEGAIDVVGTSDQSPLRGVGYLEMTGYAETGKPVIPN